jgi:hypothetical protein
MIARPWLTSKARAFTGGNRSRPGSAAAERGAAERRPRRAPLLRLRAGVSPTAYSYETRRMVQVRMDMTAIGSQQPAGRGGVRCDSSASRTGVASAASAAHAAPQSRARPPLAAAPAAAAPRRAPPRAQVLATRQAIKTLLNYLSETNGEQHLWLHNYVAGAPIPLSGARRFG